MLPGVTRTTRRAYARVRISSTRLGAETGDRSSDRSRFDDSRRGEACEVRGPPLVVDLEVAGPATGALGELGHDSPPELVQPVGGRVPCGEDGWVQSLDVAADIP